MCGDVLPRNTNVEAKKEAQIVTKIHQASFSTSFNSTGVTHLVQNAKVYKCRVSLTYRALDSFLQLQLRGQVNYVKIHGFVLDGHNPTDQNGLLLKHWRQLGEEAGWVLCPNSEPFKSCAIWHSLSVSYKIPHTTTLVNVLRSCNSRATRSCPRNYSSNYH